MQLFFLQMSFELKERGNFGILEKWCPTIENSVVPIDSLNNISRVYYTI